MCADISKWFDRHKPVVEQTNEVNYLSSITLDSNSANLIHCLRSILPLKYNQYKI